MWMWEFERAGTQVTVWQTPLKILRESKEDDYLLALYWVPDGQVLRRNECLNYSIERHYNIVFSVDCVLCLLAPGHIGLSYKWSEWWGESRAPENSQETFWYACAWITHTGCEVMLVIFNERHFSGDFRYFRSTAVSLLPEAGTVIFSLKTFKCCN